MITTVTGTVGRGAGRGETLGVPTANIELSERLDLEQGIYAGRALVQDKWYSAAISWGSAPVFNIIEPKFEVHLLDFFDQAMVGTTIRVELIKRLRDIKNFATVDELKMAMQEDIEQTRILCSRE